MEKYKRMWVLIPAVMAMALLLSGLSAISSVFDGFKVKITIHEIGLALGASRASANIQSSRQPELSKESME